MRQIGLTQTGHVAAILAFARWFVLAPCLAGCGGGERGAPTSSPQPTDSGLQPAASAPTVVVNADESNFTVEGRLSAGREMVLRFSFKLLDGEPARPGVVRIFMNEAGDGPVIVDNKPLWPKKEGDIARFEWRTKLPRRAGNYTLDFVIERGKPRWSHELVVEPDGA